MSSPFPRRLDDVPQSARLAETNGWGFGAVAIWIAACAFGSACSKVSGLDELQFDLRDAAGGGGTASGAEGGGGQGGGTGPGGAGGGGCPICDAPPDQCHEPIGSCDAGQCVYAPKASGTACDDADGCTVGDTCDGLGTCMPGDLCPNADPCLIAACVSGQCMTSDEKNGKSCGATDAERCCGGTCVDIATNESNCGGCGTACAAGKTCESVAVTDTCEIAPMSTSGRCTCTTNAQCPLGQVCRTDQPFANRCSPEAVANCDGTFINVNFCPNFCGY